MNHITIEGRLTKDPESGQTRGGTATATFSVASEGYFNGKAVTSYFDVEVYGEPCGPIVRHLAKGSSVVVFGQMEQQKWTDAETAKTRQKWVVHPDRGGVRFVGGKPNGNGAPAPATNEQPTEAPVPVGAGAGAQDDHPF
jgi:single-strand DNA-binding protein